MDDLKANARKSRTPTVSDRVFKDECVLSFDCPESENGLYVCLNTFLGFGRQYVEKYFQKTGNNVFLHLKRVKTLKVSPDECHPKKITKLAIGVEGGYNPEEESTLYDIEDKQSVVLLPSFVSFALDSPDIPVQVTQAVYGVLSAVSASKVDEAQALAGTWDGEKRQISKHAHNLNQINEGKTIPPSGWKCEQCDKTDNLWLNLTDGSILCGRKFFDGSGGNNHALEHFSQFGYPLAVKLGTITPDGADVYSYDEDDMVEDPLLDKHLAHFGINITHMKKSDKSMLELELDYNQRIGEWSLLTESDSVLKPLFGPGFTGLANLGNSCYMNSVVQVLFAIPEFQKFYFPGDKFFEIFPKDPSLDFNCQMAKLADGILSGKYSKPSLVSSQEQEGIKPTMFKNLIGRGHPEFSTKRQQDVQEFFLYLVNMVDRNSRVQGQDSPTKSLCFEIEDRIECMSSKKVRYTSRTEYILPLPVVLDKALNQKEINEYEARKSAGENLDPKDAVRPRIPLDACFESFIHPETVSDFYSTAIGSKTTACKTSRLKSFPDYLVLQIKKFELGQDWLPRKLDVSIQVPDILDLTKLRGKGIQPGEEPLPESITSNPDNVESTAASAVTFDSAAMAQINSLMDMGFTMDACKRAVHATESSGLEVALNWLFEHVNDADLNDPFTLDLAESTSGQFSPNPDALEALKNMGLSEATAIRGLKETGNVVERAVEWIFSHPEAMEETASNPVPTTSNEPPVSSCRDGAEKYRLKAFISHMGSSTMCGHYVCHILKDNKWVIFNDNKVALSECPPKELAYLYLYERI